MTRRVMTSELTQTAAGFYRAGKSTYQIARIMDFHPQTILNALTRAGVEMRHGAEAQRENLSLIELPWRPGTRPHNRFKYLKRKGLSRELAIERVRAAT